MRTCKHYANSIVYTFIHVVMYSNMKCGHEIMHNWIHVYIVIMKTMCNYVHEYIKTPVLLSISFIFFTETYQITVIWYVSKYKSYHRLLYINPASCFLWLCRASPFLCIFSLLLCSSALRANGSLAFVGVVVWSFPPTLVHTLFSFNVIWTALLGASVYLPSWHLLVFSQASLPGDALVLAELAWTCLVLTSSMHPWPWYRSPLLLWLPFHL